MDAKKKAKELTQKFEKIIYGYVSKDLSRGSESKQCVIICVNEIIESNPVEWVKGEDGIDEDGDKTESLIFRSTKTYWQEVKQEIENL